MLWEREVHLLLLVFNLGKWPFIWCRMEADECSSLCDRSPGITTSVHTEFGPNEEAEAGWPHPGLYQWGSRAETGAQHSARLPTAEEKTDVFWLYMCPGLIWYDLQAGLRPYNVQFLDTWCWLERSSTHGVQQKSETECIGTPYYELWSKSEKSSDSDENWDTDQRHSIKTTCLTCCWFVSCHQNSCGLSEHG